MIQATFAGMFVLGPTTAVTDPFFSGSSLANAIAWYLYNERND